MSLILAIDVGTSSIAVAAVDVTTDRIATSASRANDSEVQSSVEGAHEQDPDRIWLIASDLISEVCSNVDSDDVVGLVATGQMHGALLVDARGKAASNLLTWRDRRPPDTVLVSVMLESAADEHQCGCRLNPGYGLVSLRHLASAIKPSPGTRACSITDYINLRLTGTVATDRSMAASWGALDIHSTDWHWPRIDALDLPRSLFPDIRESCEPLSMIDPELANQLGLSESTAVCAGIGDHQASVLSAFPLRTGSCVVNIGTGAQVSVVANTVKVSPGIENRPLPARILMRSGASLCGGWAYEYVAKLLANGEEAENEAMYNRINSLAEDAADDAGGLVVDTRFLGDYSGNVASGSVKGITADNLTPGNLARATVNGIVDELFELYSGLGQQAVDLAVSGNAVRRNTLLRDTIANRWGLTPDLHRDSEEAARGAATVAACHLGFREFSDLYC